MYVCMYVYMYVCMCMYALLYIYMCVCIHESMKYVDSLYVCMYVCKQRIVIVYLPKMSTVRIKIKVSNTCTKYYNIL